MSTDPATYTGWAQDRGRHPHGIPHYYRDGVRLCGKVGRELQPGFHSLEEETRRYRCQSCRQWLVIAEVQHTEQTREG